MNLKTIISELPSAVQYMAIFGLVMLILYVCLTITRWVGQGRGKQVRYDDPEAYEKNVPDVFGSTFLKRDIEKNEDGKSDEKSE